MKKFTQSKLTISGKVKAWEVDTDEIKRVISWAGKNAALMNLEIEEMNKSFPHFYTTLLSSNRLSRNEIFCSECGDIIIFDQGIRCANCNTTFSAPSDSLLGYIGRVPHWIGVMSEEDRFGDKEAKIFGHPFLKHIHHLICSAKAEQKMEILKYFLFLKEKNRIKIFFAPSVYAVHPNNWPRSKPDIFVERNYFGKILFPNSGYGVSDFHAYPGGNGNLLLLCNYSNWHKTTMRTVIQQRIVPKVMIDVMIADLMAVNKLTNVLRALGTTVHGVYNFIGKPGRSERFKNEFDKYVKIDC